MAVPKKDSALVAWSINFNTRGTLTPLVFNLTAAQMTAYTALHDPFIAAMNAMGVVGARSKSLVSAKNTAKDNLLPYARELYSYVQASMTVSDANKDLLGVTVKRGPTPIPIPSSSPTLRVKTVSGWTATVKLSDEASGAVRGKPPFAIGAALFSFVGAEPPSNVASWKFEGNTGRTQVDVAFDDTLAPGTRVWLTAFWFNNRKQSGPACPPVGTNLQGGSVATVA